MGIVAFLLVGSLLSACLLLVSAAGARGAPRRSETPKKNYTKFQSLGFSIFTGPAPAVNTTETLRRLDEGSCKYTRRSCPTAVWKFANRIVCPACFVFNEECNCDPNSMTCQYSATPMVTGSLSLPGCYLGDFDTARDIQGRLSIMETAVQRAHEVSSKDENTLKIFVAPEFFWRGPTGAYSFDSIADPSRVEEDETNALSQISRGLEAIVGQGKYKDWLFVFGTIVAFAEEGGKNTNIKRHKKTNAEESQYEFLNFSPVYRGYDPSAATDAGTKFIVPKYYISGIDFLTNDRPDPADDQRFYDNKVFRDIQSWLEDERGYQMVFDSWFFGEFAIISFFSLLHFEFTYPVLKVDNIAFSLEICLDHSQGVAKFFLNSNLKYVPSGGDGAVPKPPGAQISLVSSAGMSIVGKSLALLSGGTIFLQDGLYTKSQQRTCKKGRGISGKYACEDSAHIYYDLYSTMDEAQEALDGLYTMTEYPPQIHVYQYHDIVPMPTEEPLQESSSSAYLGKPKNLLLSGRKRR